MPPKSQKSSGLKPRPPIVAVMGHVDHGKTSLLDYIRKANVVAKEAGGITQSVGAYEIEHQSSNTDQPKRITFIDTPGHEAFKEMRSRGATVADLAILVVAGDEGPKLQTIESIKILTETKTPFVVAITKTDKPGANIEKVKSELTAAGVLLEGFGGSVSYQTISAKSGDGVKELLDHLLLAAEVENLTYDPALPGEGFVLEARMSRQRGNEVSVIVKNGTLRFGNEIATATAHGKVKILENFLGKAAKSLEPSAPAIIVGFETLPQIGETFASGTAAATLRSAPTTEKKDARVLIAQSGKPVETLNVILKAADAGSLEALAQIVGALTLEKPVRIVTQSVGDVIDNDVKLAISTGSTVAAFATRIDKGAKTLAEANRITILSSDVIYHLVKAIEDFALSAKVLSAGTLEVLAVFNSLRFDKQVVGGKVTEGSFRNKAPFEIERVSSDAEGGKPQRTIVGHGRVLNLQAQKKDASTVGVGTECGLMVNADIAVAVGDKLVIRV